MDKKFLSRILVTTVILAAAVLWLLSVIPGTQDMFSWFSLAWAAVMLAGALGVKYLLSGIFGGGDVVSKKTCLWVGAAFLVLTLFCLTWAIAMPDEWIAPLIAIILAGALFLGVLFTGGRKWDAGDNQKAGYKNYHQRKAAEKSDAE